MSRSCFVNFLLREVSLCDWACDSVSQASWSLISNTLMQVQKELGLQIHPWQESIIDMATTLIQRGIAKPVSAQ